MSNSIFDRAVYLELLEDIRAQLRRRPNWKLESHGANVFVLSIGGREGFPVSVCVSLDGSLHAKIDRCKWNLVHPLGHLGQKAIFPKAAIRLLQFAHQHALPFLSAGLTEISLAKLILWQAKQFVLLGQPRDQAPPASFEELITYALDEMNNKEPTLRQQRWRLLLATTKGVWLGNAISEWSETEQRLLQSTLSHKVSAAWFHKRYQAIQQQDDARLFCELSEQIKEQYSTWYFKNSNLATLLLADQTM